MELHTKGTSEKDSSMDYMLLQGVRFAFRIHQVCKKNTSNTSCLTIVMFHDNTREKIYAFQN